MYKTSLLLIVVFLMLISCKREPDVTLEPGREVVEGSVLIRKVDESTTPGTSGIYSTTTEYEYDSSKRLIKSVATSNSGDKTRLSVSDLSRDSRGRITDIQVISRRLMNGLPHETAEGPALDTTFTSVIYNNENSGNIKYIKRTVRSGAKTAIDSTVYEYDNNGHVTKTSAYFLPWGIHQPGEALSAAGHNTWFYNAAGDLLKLEQYVFNNGNSTLNIRYEFEYDNKTNPLYAKDNIFLDNWNELSPKNVIKQNVYVPITGENYGNTVIYTYRSDDKPLTATHLSPVVNGSMKTTFYYK